jgi:hypothetical protein
VRFALGDLWRTAKGGGVGQSVALVSTVLLMTDD